jgi:ketosteroid isomerase-like protein
VTSKYFRTDGPAPRGMGDSDPVAVAEIIALEAAIYDLYNTEFLTNPGAVVDAHYTASPDVSFYDLLVPGEYSGEDVRKYFNFIGPQFTGLMEASDIRVWARGDTGFVVLKQHYQGGDPESDNAFHWIMRQTDGVVREDGEWKVAHTHYSWPVSPPPDFRADLLCTPGPHPWDVTAG